MKGAIPYRAAGTFAGPSYVEREADRLLLEAIQQNRRYPYIVAARQSGKSSLLVRARGALDPARYKSAFVDLSTFSLADYEGFWRSFLEEIAASAALDASALDPRRPENTLRAWLDGSVEQLCVFVDEIDTLIGAPFCDQFFSKLRSLFNKRAEEPKFERLVIVLAGAAHPTQLIKDHMRSPFNVGLEIKLDDLTLGRAREFASHLAGSGAKVGEGIAERVHAATGGSVYLGQLLLERLWAAGEARGAIELFDVDAALAAIVERAGSEVHFRNIYQLVANNARLLAALGELRAGQPIEERSAQDLRLAGISDGATPFRNEVYRRVFDEGGPLDLVRLTREAETVLPPTMLAPALPAQATSPMASIPGAMPVPAPQAPAASPARISSPAPSHGHSDADLEQARKRNVELVALGLMETREGEMALNPTGLITDDVHALAAPTAAPAALQNAILELVVSGLEQARERKKALDRAGLPTEGVAAEIRTLRQKLREGGQLRAGDSLEEDRYLLTEEIGRGGFASVWKALDRQTGLVVALKILHPSLAADPARREHFLRGANAMAALSHPAIVRILKPYGEDEGWLYFVMEFLSGGSLRRAVLERHMSAAESLRLVLRTGEALAYAHARGVLHQDVKPASVLLTEEGEPKLTDFSLALVALEETTSQTRTGALESFFYAAPETLDRLEDADARADVYGLGMTAIFCLYGADLPAHAFRKIAPILEGLPCDEAVKRVLGRAVRWERSERFEDVAAFSAALREALARELLRSALATAPAGAPFAQKPPGEPGAVAASMAPEKSAAPESVRGIGAAHQAAPTGAVPARDRRFSVRVPLAAATLITLALGVKVLAPIVLDTPHPLGEVDAGGTVPLSPSNSASTAPLADADASAPLAPRERCPEGMLPITGFCLDRTEVTVASYRACVNANGCKEPDTLFTPFCSWGQPDRDNHPVSCVSFDHASAYCSFVGARLPFEDEWELAAGGVLGFRFPWGGSLRPNPEKRLNACDLECRKLFHTPQGLEIPTLFDASDGFRTTAPVGSFPFGISPFGVLDMAGNVAEWTYGRDGTAVIRGGSWNDHDPGKVSTTSRTVAPRDTRSAFVGFRCARTIGPAAERPNY